MPAPARAASAPRAGASFSVARKLKWGAGYRRDPLFLFPGDAGAPRKPDRITRRRSRLLELACISGAQPRHGWRHTAATVMLHAGHNIKTVQTRLGHASPAITLSLYVHPDEEQDTSAANHLGDLLGKA